MRIAYLTTSYPEVSHTFIRREILALEALGHEVDRLAIRPPESHLVDADDIAEAELTYYCLPNLLRDLPRALWTSPLRLWAALRMTLAMARVSHRGLVVNLAYLLEAIALARRLRERGIQHVHVHFGTNAAAAARLVKALGGPTYSMTIHGPAELDNAIGFSLGPKIEDAEFVVAITDYCGAQLRRWVAPEHWEKIRVVHCAVPDGLFEQATPIARETNTLVCVGRLTAQKGQLLLLDALRQVLDEGLDAKLVLAGDGEMRPEVERRIAGHRLEEHVEITGWIDAPEVARRLQAARAMVLPSFAEGLPVVIMEALALCRPVLSTYIAGIPELVVPGQSGWLVPAGNVEAIARAMREILETPTERLDEMGREGARAVHERHHLPTEVSRLEKIFREYVRS
ncbi:MAG: glycosyltransferase family 4 protein [Spirochaetaceae bacterium]|nr:glycosyltransferase family 4 protein [Spirochaetaceae bacterium]